MESVEIQWTASGKPLRVLRQGRVWTVVVEPTSWFERIAWWRTEARVGKSDGVVPPFRIDIKVWQVQVTLGSRASDTVTWLLMERPQTGGWEVQEPGWKVP